MIQRWIVQEMYTKFPLSLEFEEDARYVYPKREEFLLATLEEMEKEKEALLLELRKVLLFRHGHKNQYLDDGELQCGDCIPVWDYLRHDIVDLTKNVLDRLTDALEEKDKEIASLKAEIAQRKDIEDSLQAEIVRLDKEVSLAR